MSSESRPTLRRLLRQQAGSADTMDGCLVIAEVAQAHDGSLGLAHAYIDAIADAGADAVKFQTHIAAAESTPSEPWRVKFSRQDATRYDYWKRMEFTKEQWHGLRRHADARGLLFLSSPFSLEALELLEEVGVAAWKVASGELSNEPMIARMVASGLPLLLSTGMSGTREIDATVARAIRAEVPLAVMQCTTAYPCPSDRVGINMLAVFRERYGCAVGLSDHSGTIFPSLAAVTLGAEVVEVHATMSREMFGPDVTASVTTAELQQLVTGVRFIEEMRAHPVDKERQSVEAAPLRALFTKSVVARVAIPAGTVLRQEHLAAKKPGNGIPAARLAQLVGARTTRALEPDQQLTELDLVELP